MFWLADNWTQAVVITLDSAAAVAVHLKGQMNADQARVLTSELNCPNNGQRRRWLSNVRQVECQWTPDRQWCDVMIATARRRLGRYRCSVLTTLAAYNGKLSVMVWRRSVSPSVCLSPVPSACSP